MFYEEEAYCYLEAKGLSATLKAALIFLLEYYLVEEQCIMSGTTNGITKVDLVDQEACVMMLH